MHSGTMRSTLQVTKALSDVQRLRILMLLRAGELCVCQLIAVLGLAPSTVSKHLSILSAAGLVDSRKDGRWAYYRLPEGSALRAAGPVLKWLGAALGDEASVAADNKRLRATLACSPGALTKVQRKQRADFAARR